MLIITATAHQAHLDGHQSQAGILFTFTAISFTAFAPGHFDSTRGVHVSVYSQCGKLTGSKEQGKIAIVKKNKNMLFCLALPIVAIIYAWNVMAECGVSKPEGWRGAVGWRWGKCLRGKLNKVDEVYIIGAHCQSVTTVPCKRRHSQWSRVRVSLMQMHNRKTISTICQIQLFRYLGENKKSRDNDKPN